MEAVGNYFKTDLISRVRCGGLNFERFVEVLQTKGYITEEHGEAGCSPSSPVMEAARQEDFNKLFDLFFPGSPNEIKLGCTATNKGFEPAMPGNFSYAIFNANVIDRQAVDRILEAENRAWSLSENG